MELHTLCPSNVRVVPRGDPSTTRFESARDVPGHTTETSFRVDLVWTESLLNDTRRSRSSLRYPFSW